MSTPSVPSSMDETVASADAPATAGRATAPAGAAALPYGPGSQVGRYVVLSRLGAGAMGVVLAAYDPELDRKVALKLLRQREGPRGDAARARLQREAQALAQLNHRNVVHIYFVGRDPESPYLAMELVGGSTLAERMQSPLPYAEVVSIGLQVVQALRQSARFDIIHGDIKPGNILLDEGVVKLSDFGLSQRISDEGLSPGTVAGTPNYMAPEVCSGQPADVRSDQYSLGVMLFEMVTGSRPFSARSTMVCSCPASKSKLASLTA